jgi:hypothetical protein
VKTGFVNAKVPTDFSGTITKNNILTGSEPGFVDFAGKNFRLMTDALSGPVGYPSEVTVNSVETLWEIKTTAVPKNLEPSIARSDNSDYGAFDFSPAGPPETAPQIPR